MISFFLEVGCRTVCGRVSYDSMLIVIQTIGALTIIHTIIDYLVPPPELLPPPERPPPLEDRPPPPEEPLDEFIECARRTSRYSL